MTINRLEELHCLHVNTAETVTDTRIMPAIVTKNNYTLRGWYQTWTHCAPAPADRRAQAVKRRNAGHVKPYGITLSQTKHTKSYQ